MRHNPTGITAKSATKHQQKNRKIARELLEQRVNDLHTIKSMELNRKIKRNLAGSGMRGDKIRTYREQDNQIKDHRTNKNISLHKVMRGELNLLF